MSVRRRSIGNRLRRDLEAERASHKLTRARLEAIEKALVGAIAHRDAAQRERDRLLDLAAELGRYFTDPPAELSRESDLFLLLQEVARQCVPALPPPPLNPAEVLQTVFDGIAGGVAGYVGEVMTSVIGCSMDTATGDTRPLSQDEAQRVASEGEIVELDEQS